MSSTPPCPTQTDGRASVHDPTPNFRAPRTSMPTFSLLLQQCDRVLCSHLEVSKASKLWSWCKMEPDGHYYPTRDSYHFSNPTRKAAKEQIANRKTLIKSVQSRTEKGQKGNLSRVCENLLVCKTCHYQHYCFLSWM